MSKPLVVQVIPTLGGGGAEREVARVSKVLKDQGEFDVVVCCIMGRGSFADDIEKSGVEVVVLNEGKRFSPVMAWDLIRFFRNRKPVIAHSHLLRWGPVVAKMAGVPVAIMTEHGAAPWRSAAGILFDRANIFFADKLVAVSSATKDVRMKKWKIPGRKIAVIPNAIDIDEVAVPVEKAAIKVSLGLPEDAPVVGIVGRLISIKGHKYFIEAACRILKQYPDCRFLIVGEGSSKPELEQQTQDLGIADNAKFLGFRNDVRELTQIFDVAVLSSLSEGTPITALEAMACRKPMVVTRVGGCPEVVVDEVTGLIVPPEDSIKLADAIMSVIADSERAAAMGEAGYKRVREHFSVQVNLEHQLRLYKETLASKNVFIGS